jgi:hypothetical protein
MTRIDLCRLSEYYCHSLHNFYSDELARTSPLVEASQLLAYDNPTSWYLVFLINHSPHHFNPGRHVITLVEICYLSDFILESDSLKARLWEDDCGFLANS